MMLENVLDVVLHSWIHQGQTILQDKFPEKTVTYPEVTFFNKSMHCTRPDWISYYADEHAILLNYRPLSRFYKKEGKIKTEALLTYMLLAAILHYTYSMPDEKVVEATGELMDMVFADWRVLLENTLRSLKKKEFLPFLDQSKPEHKN